MATSDPLVQGERKLLRELIVVGYVDAGVSIIEESQLDKAGVDLVGAVIGGYEVVKQGKYALLAKAEGRVDPWVAWSYTVDENGAPDAYWGRYGCEEYANSAFINIEGVE